MCVCCVCVYMYTCVCGVCLYSGRVGSMWETRSVAPLLAYVLTELLTRVFTYFVCINPPSQTRAVCNAPSTFRARYNDRAHGDGDNYDEADEDDHGNGDGGDSNGEVKHGDVKNSGLPRATKANWWYAYHSRLAWLAAVSTDITQSRPYCAFCVRPSTDSL